MFAESGFLPEEVVRLLNGDQAGPYSCSDSQDERIQIVTRFAPPEFARAFDSDNQRLTIRRLRTKSTVILLAVLHFQSRAHWTPDDQALEATVLQREITQTEETVGFQRTVLVGDLNMNPFDKGVIGAQALNAVMTRDLAAAEERTVSSKSYRFFYNPMWGHFGDRTPGPAGTYFLHGSMPINYYWNMYDQVLLRPELMNSLEELRILDTDGQSSLLSDKGRPRHAETSDHLPILFRLNI